MRSEISPSRFASIDVSTLPEEILICIFIRLDIYQVTIARGVCKYWLSVADHNQSLWRVFEWDSQKKKKGSFMSALDLVEEKSKSTIEEVAILESTVSVCTDLGSERLREAMMRTLNRCRDTLRKVSIMKPLIQHISPRVLELASSSTRLKSIVLWTAPTSYQPLFRPKIRSSAEKVRSNQLDVLWLWPGLNEVQVSWIQNHDCFKHLISYAEQQDTGLRRARPIISNFSETVVHLTITILSDGWSISEPVLVPNLRFFQGAVHAGISFFFDAPQLHTVCLEDAGHDELKFIPPSVEQIWIGDGSILTGGFWEPLLDSCPKLSTLKLLDAFVISRSPSEGVGSFGSLFQSLEGRKRKVQCRAERNEVEICSIRKVILPINRFTEAERATLSNIVEEVVDIHDDPSIIEFEI